MLCLGARALAQKDNSDLKSDKKNEWPVKYVAVPKKSNAGAKLELVITDQSARCKKGKEMAPEIPAASISEVGYDNSSHNRGWAYLKGVDTWLNSGGAGIGKSREDTIIFTPLLAPAAILSAFKSTKHFVRILWEDKGNPSEVLLEVGKQDYHVLLDELQRLWGKSWIGLPQARKKLVSEIELRILMIVDTNSDEA